MEGGRGSSRFPVHLATRNERGVTLIWAATMLVLLLGASAFATDLGWIYLNGARLQRAADAAALAGVVNLPAFVDEAEADAVDASGRNGFPIVRNGRSTLTNRDWIGVRLGFQHSWKTGLFWWSGTVNWSDRTAVLIEPDPDFG